MAIFSGAHSKRLRVTIDSAVYRLCVLSDDSLTPEVLDRIEAELAQAARYTAARVGSAKVVDLLEAHRPDVSGNQSSTWNHIVSRAVDNARATP
jgi:hypothetical protein